MGFIIFLAIVFAITLPIAIRVTRNQERERDEYAAWRKARIAKFPNEPTVDLSYRRFCDETGRYYVD